MLPGSLNLRIMWKSSATRVNIKIFHSSWTYLPYSSFTLTYLYFYWWINCSITIYFQEFNASAIVWADQIPGLLQESDFACVDVEGGFKQGKGAQLIDSVVTCSLPRHRLQCLRLQWKSLVSNRATPCHRSWLPSVKDCHLLALKSEW